MPRDQRSDGQKQAQQKAHPNEKEVQRGLVIEGVIAAA